MKHAFYHDISLEPLCKAHLDDLAVHLRREDKAELWAAYRLPVRQALQDCARKSAAAFALVRRGRTMAAAGVEAQSLLGRRACVWSWTGRDVLFCPKIFWRFSCIVRDYFLSLYPQLYAACDVRYAAAQRYLRRLGACATKEKIYLAGKETRFVLYVFERPKEA